MSVKYLFEGPLRWVYLPQFLKKADTVGHSRSLEMNLEAPVVHCYTCTKCFLYLLFPCLPDFPQEALTIWSALLQTCDWPTSTLTFMVWLSYLYCSFSWDSQEEVSTPPFYKTPPHTSARTLPASSCTGEGEHLPWLTDSSSGAVTTPDSSLYCQHLTWVWQMIGPYRWVLN